MQVSWLSETLPHRMSQPLYTSLIRRGSALSLLGITAAMSLGGCAQQPQHLAYAGHGKEYFPSSIYGPASPKVVADGEPVPRGGGSYMVGKPYTVAGHTYYPSEKRYAAVGIASWYGDAFHGRRTANGEIYDKDSISAAHPTMPLPSYARVTNLQNHYSMIVRVNDRGPFAADRIMDVSRRVAQALKFHGSGSAKVKVEYVGNASLAGSDDNLLLASLRNDGRPASLDSGDGVHTMIAEAAPAVRTASAETSVVPLSEPAVRHVSEPPVRPVLRGSIGTLIEKELAADADTAASSSAGTAPIPPVRPYDLGTGASPSHGLLTARR